VLNYRYNLHTLGGPGGGADNSAHNAPTLTEEQIEERIRQMDLRRARLREETGYTGPGRVLQADPLIIEPERLTLSEQKEDSAMFDLLKQMEKLKKSEHLADLLRELPNMNQEDKEYLWGSEGIDVDELHKVENLIGQVGSDGFYDRLSDGANLMKKKKYLWELQRKTTTVITIQLRHIMPRKYMNTIIFLGIFWSKFTN